MKLAFHPAAKPLAVAVALLGAPGAHALQFELPNDIKASVDTTLTYGVSIRASGRDPALIGIVNGGTSRSVNEDDGDLNFAKGKPFANLVKATVETELKWHNFGFFGRGLAFYDFDLANSDKLGPIGRDRLGRGVQGLDGFVSASFEPIWATSISRPCVSCRDSVPRATAFGWLRFGGGRRSGVARLGMERVVGLHTDGFR